MKAFTSTHLLLLLNYKKCIKSAGKTLYSLGLAMALLIAAPIIIFPSGNKAMAQTCPGGNFFPYNGGNITFATANANGQCYNNLTPGQTYCFSYLHPVNGIIEMDINISGCSSCPTSMYTNITANSASSSISGGGVSNNNACVTFNPTNNAANCNFITYDGSCNQVVSGVRVGRCAGFTPGQIYTYCFTVPATCTNMSICPLYRCLNCALPPVVNTSGGTICEEECFNLIASGSGGTPPYTYNWSHNIGAGAGPVSVCPTATTVYTVTITDGSGNTSTAVATVTVNAAPVVSVSPNAAICNGISTQLSASGGVSYSWSPAAGLNNPNIANPMASPTATTTYTVTVSSADNCTATGTVTVSIGAGPDVTISSPPSAGCLRNTIYIGFGPQSITLTAGSTPPASSYQWYLNGSPITGATSSTYAATAAGVYNVIASDVSGCLSDSTGKSVKVNIVDVRCGNDLKKITLCHVPDGKPSNPQTICVASSAIPAHIGNHPGDCLGPCTLSSRSGNMSGEGSSSPTINETVFAAYPNPFTDETVISFSTPGGGTTSVELYDINGKLLNVLFTGNTEGSADYFITLSGHTLEAGIYIISLKTGHELMHQKLVLTR